MVALTLTMIIWIVGIIIGVGLTPFLINVLKIGKISKAAGGLIGNYLWWIASIASNGSVIWMTSDGGYERRNYNSMEPEQNREQFKGYPFGVTYERTRQIFGNILSEAPAEAQAYDRQMDDRYVRGDRDRGDEPTYIDCRQDEEKIWVDSGEALGRLKNSATTKASQDATTEAKVKHGGNTAEYSQKTILIGCLIFVLLGLAVGFFYFPP